MNKVSSILNLRIASVVILLAVAGFSTGCTLSGIDDNVTNDVSNNDLRAASQILGTSLSSDNSGVILSLNDAMTSVSKDGFTSISVTGSHPKSVYETTLGDDSGWGDESNYSYSYDPSSGIHKVSFTRTVDKPLFSKSVKDTLHYLYRGSNGDYIEFPRQQKDMIGSINYTGHRQGTVDNQRRNSTFIRRDTLLIDGISPESPILQIDGIHTSEGVVKFENSDGDRTTRNYKLEINFLNIELEKTVVQNGLEQGVTGTLSWEMTIANGSIESQRSKILRGTVEMNGDGTALLRFRKFLKIFQVNLDDGDVKDQDREFEGRVVSVDMGNGSFTLQSGYQIFINNQTSIDDDDYSSLKEVQQAIQNGNHVWAEGEGFRRDNRFIATEVEFENEEADDHEGENREFEEIVTSADAANSTFTLANEVLVQVNDQTEIDDSGDYMTLREVRDALSKGVRVLAEGEAVIPENNSGVDLVALEVSFETDGEEDDSNEEED